PGQLLRRDGGRAAQGHEVLLGPRGAREVQRLPRRGSPRAVDAEPRQPRERLLLRHHRDLPAGPDALHVSAGLDARLSRCPGAGATTSSCPAPVPPPMTGLDARSSVPPPPPGRERAADVA